MSYKNDEYECPITEDQFNDAASLLEMIKDLADFAKTTGDLAAIKEKVDELKILPASCSRWVSSAKGLATRFWMWELLEKQLLEVTSDNYMPFQGETQEQALAEVRHCIITDYFSDHPEVLKALETIENYDDGYAADVRWTYESGLI